MEKNTMKDLSPGVYIPRCFTSIKISHFTVPFTSIIKVGTWFHAYYSHGSVFQRYKFGIPIFLRQYAHQRRSETPGSGLG
jgi:hypothetical protein